MAKLNEIISEISRKHLENGGLIMGQCLTAVGWVGGTVPKMTVEEGIIELSMSDVAGGYMAAGVALAGRRPIYIVRYQGFQHFNAIGIVNYAAKAKEMWGTPCPVFIRSIAMDAGGEKKKRGIGPVASGSHHGIYNRMNGVPIFAPMTPNEYRESWDYFMTHDTPIYISEHRRGWEVDYEMKDIIKENAEITLMPISSTRLNTIEAVKELEKENINCNLIHIFCVKPFELNRKDELIQQCLKNSKYGGIIIDGDFSNGVAKPLAYDLMHKYDRKVFALGLEERTAGFAPHLDNLPPPKNKIIKTVKKLISRE